MIRGGWGLRKFRCGCKYPNLFITTLVWNDRQGLQKSSRGGASIRVRIWVLRKHARTHNYPEFFKYPKLFHTEIARNICLKSGMKSHRSREICLMLRASKIEEHSRKVWRTLVGIPVDDSLKYSPPKKRLTETRMANKPLKFR